MSVIDIRDNKSCVNQIVFAYDDKIEENAVSVKLASDNTDALHFLDPDGYKEGVVMLDDIPNLIKALEKAYELWKQ